MLLKLAWRNIWRNKKRTFITMFSIVFAVVLSILLDSVKKGLLDKMKENVVSFYTGYIQIHKKGYWDDKTLENSFDWQPELIDNLERNKSISLAIPRLESFILAASEKYSKGCMVVGIDPEKESSVTSLAEKITKGNYLLSSDKAVLVTEGLASYLKLDVNDTLVLIGQGYHGVSAAGKFPIKGLIKFGSPDLNKGLVYLPLKESQRLFAADNKLTALVLSPTRTDKVKELVHSLQLELTDDYEVMNWQLMMPELDQVIAGEKAENVIFQVVLYLLIAFGIFGTVLMMTLERQYEFGVLIAIGMKNFRLSTLVVLENVLISVLGAIGGIILSIPIVFYLFSYPIKLGGKLAEAYEKFGIEPIFYFSMAPRVFYSQGLVVFFLALFLSLYPFIKIRRLEPVSAMHS
ncbi:ABC transporter permease [Fulvivirgaceae bacterium BMA12]|uniref:ABC transporter permease n=1 Tax=Agaribacillus aureus TaxID=3051825 RepID=A0ABT8L854_9BACT|nr:ABC transporter permease [Fulvivirgaceae bacterium BMA12]